MSARDDMLSAVRRNRPDERELPPARSDARTAIPSHRDEQVLPPARSDVEQSPDVLAAFVSRTKTNGGTIVHLEQRLDDWLRDAFSEAGRTVCTVPGSSFGTVRPDSRDALVELGSLDVLVCRGTLAVAENGAVWVTDNDLVVRAAAFLAEHLVLVVPVSAVCRDLHAAYARLRIDETGFGLFIAGPSKTADIEQTLVVGAQGPVRHTVVLTAS